MMILTGKHVYTYMYVVYVDICVLTVCNHHTAMFGQSVCMYVLRVQTNVNSLVRNDSGHELSPLIG